MSLNPEEGPNFVSVYIDNVLVFYRTLEDNLRRLKAVIQRIQEAGLKLKPSKCYFLRREVEYLGHVITTQALKTTPRLVSAVRELPTPSNICETRQLLGLSSYYRRFITLFVKLARPLHQLTKKGAMFDWNEECQTAFRTLKMKLSEAPVLCYPSFNKDFTLETDASIEGLCYLSVKKMVTFIQLPTPAEPSHSQSITTASQSWKPSLWFRQFLIFIRICMGMQSRFTLTTLQSEQFWRILTLQSGSMRDGGQECMGVVLSL